MSPRPPRALALSFALWAALLAAACEDAPGPPDDTAQLDDSGDTAQLDDSGDTSPGDATPLGALPGPAPRFDPARSELYAAPVPAPDLFTGGHPRLDALPRDPGTFVDDLVALAEDADGASLAGTTYFAFDAPLTGAQVASLSAAYLPLAPADPADPSLARPARLHYEDDGGPFGAPNLLAVQPIQGLPLAPATRYAVAVWTTPEARPTLGRTPLFADLLAGRPVPGLADRPAWDAALAAATHPSAPTAALLVALTTYTTADPTRELGELLAAARASTAPDLSTPLALLEVHERFCVFGATLEVPDYQHGPLPFSNPGEGTFRKDAEGRFTLARLAPSRLFVTVPRAPAPPAGYPLALFIRTGGGGDRPLIDRGPRAVAHGPPIVPTGTGPAMNLAAAGWAGLTWDGPHGGPRNPTGGDEQFLMFNVLNAAGTRDGIRQTALEAALLAERMGDLAIDTSACLGASPEARFDPDHLALMGHSMGAWIAPLALAFAPDLRAAILSGAGGSWSANVVYKQSPLEVAPLAEVILGYDALGRELHPFDPAVALLQWAGEVADPQVYGALARDRSILMIEGIVDTYILPPIAQATSLSLALDLAGPSADDDPRLSAYEPLVPLLPLAGAAHIDLPAHENRGPHTAVVVHAPGDQIEDGHEAAFQTPGPKHQYRCFLETLARDGAPTVPAPADEWTPCEAPP